MNAKVAAATQQVKQILRADFGCSGAILLRLLC